MYALVKTGGKQYKVQKDDTILVERLAAEEGEQVILNDVIMIGDGDKIKLGEPTLVDAAVSATVLRQTRGPKIIVFRRKRRKNHRRTQGHRQDLTLLKINEVSDDIKKIKIVTPEKKTKSTKKTAAKKVEADKIDAKKPAVKKTAAKKTTSKKTTSKKPAPKKTVAKKSTKKK